MFSRGTHVVVAELRWLGKYFIPFPERTGLCPCLSYKITRNQGLSLLPLSFLEVVEVEPIFSVLNVVVGAQRQETPPSKIRL
jgi:hypothetical protein